MSVSKTISSYVKQVMAQLKGNTQQAIAEKNERIIRAKLTAQISAQKGELPLLEGAIEDMQESLTRAIHNIVMDSEGNVSTSLITNYDAYQSKVLDAREELAKAEDAKEAMEESIKLLEEDLKNLG